MRIVKQDVQDAVSLHQFCTDFDSGCESAVHCMSCVFDTNEAALFVDASIALNSFNRAVTLRNVQFVCPALALILINTYRFPASLHVNGQILSSQELPRNSNVCNWNQTPDLSPRGSCILSITLMTLQLEATCVISGDGGTGFVR